MNVLDVEGVRRVRRAVFDDGDPGAAQILYSATLRMSANLAGLAVYDTLTERVAAFMDRLAHDFPFERANLLTAVAAGLVLLMINGYRLRGGETYALELAEMVADHSRSIQACGVWLEDRLEEASVLEQEAAIEQVATEYSDVWDHLANESP